MPDIHFVVDIYLGKNIMASIDVAARDAKEAEVIAVSQIRVKPSKGYGTVEIPKAEESSGLPSFKKQE